MEVTIRELGRPGDLGWVVQAHGEVYDAEFGWDTDFEGLVARIVADYAAGHDARREAAWIAELDGRRVGCVFCVADPDDPVAARLRLLLLHPDARGHGLGGRLVDTCLCFARAAGYARVRLWTNHPLEAARRVYLSRGFMLTDEARHHSFGVDLTGQTYELDLRGDDMTQTPSADLLRSLYRAFNARDIDSVLAAMTPDVDWPNGWEGGRVTGHDAVREYWQRQWEAIDPSVEPTDIAQRADGGIEVTVRQVVRDKAGAVIADRVVRHVYAFRDGLVRRMEIEE
jgi:GNAT superfamily N-acetyltransferase/ketosteroid isomerase-like protein